jgi:hypothetical protein
MDHFSISNAVDSRGAFRIVGVATPNALYCSGFLVQYVKWPLRKLATKIFEMSLFI